MFSKNSHFLNFSPNDRVGDPSSNQTRISLRRSNFITGTGIGALFLCFLSIMLFAVYVVGSIGAISTPQNDPSLSVPTHLN